MRAMAPSRVAKRFGSKASVPGGAFDLGAGFGRGIVADGAHGMGLVQRLSATGKGDPGAGVDPTSLVVYHEEPERFAGRVDTFFAAVVEGVDVSGVVEMDVAEIDLEDHLRRRGSRGGNRFPLGVNSISSSVSLCIRLSLPRVLPGGPAMA